MWPCRNRTKDKMIIMHQKIFFSILSAIHYLFVPSEEADKPVRVWHLPQFENRGYKPLSHWSTEYTLSLHLPRVCAWHAPSVANCWAGARGPWCHFVISACLDVHVVRWRGRVLAHGWLSGFFPIGRDDASDVRAVGIADEKGEHVLWHM